MEKEIEFQLLLLKTYEKYMKGLSIKAELEELIYLYGKKEEQK